jgi:uncharacterized membrane protein YhaH (DUF805 family)
MDWKWYLFSFEGRISRGRFWLSFFILLGWMLFIMWMMWIVMLGTVMLQARVQPHGHEIINVSFGFDEIFTLLGRAFHLSLSLREVISLVGNLFGMTVFMWICLATSVKRLHDRSKSGWWIVPFFVLPSFSSNIQGWVGESILTFPIGLALFVLCIWGFIEMGFLRGSFSSNRFGPSPHREPRSGVSTPGWDQSSEFEFAPHIGSPRPAMHVKRGA